MSLRTMKIAKYGAVFILLGSLAHSNLAEVTGKPALTENNTDINIKATKAIKENGTDWTDQAAKENRTSCTGSPDISWKFLKPENVTNILKSIHISKVSSEILHDLLVKGIGEIFVNHLTSTQVFNRIKECLVKLIPAQNASFVAENATDIVPEIEDIAEKFAHEAIVQIAEAQNMSMSKVIQMNESDSVEDKLAANIEKTLVTHLNSSHEDLSKNLVEIVRKHYTTNQSTSIEGRSLSRISCSRRSKRRPCRRRPNICPNMKPRPTPPTRKPPSRECSCCKKHNHPPASNRKNSSNTNTPLIPRPLPYPDNIPDCNQIPPASNPNKPNTPLAPRPLPYPHNIPDCNQIPPAFNPINPITPLIPRPCPYPDDLPDSDQILPACNPNNPTNPNPPLIPNPLPYPDNLPDSDHIPPAYNPNNPTNPNTPLIPRPLLCPYNRPDSN